MTRCGISSGIYKQVYSTCVIYMAWDLAMEASYTIYKNDY